LVAVTNHHFVGMQEDLVMSCIICFLWQQIYMNRIWTVKSQLLLYPNAMFCGPRLTQNNSGKYGQLNKSEGGVYIACCLFCKEHSTVLIYFTSAAVTVDSSHMTASSSASWSIFLLVHLNILLPGTCRQCGSLSVTGHNHRKVIG